MTKKYNSTTTIALAMTCLVVGLLSNFSVAQTVLVNSDFEPGDPTAWTFANAASTNQWYIGTATSSTGTQSAYVSADGGATNSYGVTTLSTNHIYTSVTFPAGESAIVMSFDWKGIGEVSGIGGTTYDYLRVSLTSAAPVGGTFPAVADQLPVIFAGQPGYTKGWIVIPASNAGTTKNLVFTWRNDGSIGTPPSASIDNVLLVSAIPAPLSGTLTIPGTFPSFGSAISALNANGVGAGGVIFDVTSGSVFNETPPAIIATGTLGNTITFQKSGAGLNPLINSTGTGNWGPTSTGSVTGNGDAVIRINGGDYITFDGIDASSGNFTGTSSCIEFGYLIVNVSAADGAMNNTIKNASIVLNRTSTAPSIGIHQTVNPTQGGFAPSSAAGANSNNTYMDITVKNAYTGVFFNGNATYPDLNTKFTTALCTNFNTIGDPVTPNDIGGLGTQSYGIRATNQSSFIISNNKVRNISATSPTSLDGILIETFAGISELSNNIVQTVFRSSTTSTSTTTGIRMSHTTTGTHELRVFNNSVSDIRSAYTGAATATRGIRAMYISGTGGATTQVYNIHNNNVSVDGSGSPNLSNSIFEVSTSSGPVFNLGNNVFANFTPAQGATAKHYVMVTTSATTFGNTGSSSNNNDLYIANDQGVSGFIGRGNTIDYATLANWQTGITSPAGIDAASLSVDPMFVNNVSDLHANALALNGAAMTPPAYITVDLDCATRTPDNDIGAYILTTCSGTPTAGNITGVSAVCSGLGTTLTLNGASSGAGITYQWASSTTAGGPYTNMGTATTQATGALTSTTYYIVTVTCAFSSSVNTSEFTVTVNPSPTVTVTPTTATYCTGTAPIALSASGATTFSWTPSAGLDVTNIANVNATPGATTTYTVTGTDGNGCIGTATAAITVTETPSVSSLTATPASICEGGNSQLNAMAGTTATYSVSTPAFSFLSCQANPGPTGDDVVQGPNAIGFGFNYYGVTYTQFGISTNGNIQLGNGSGGVNNPTYNNQFTDVAIPAAALPNNMLALAWDDWLSAAGEITWGTTGVAPNRKLIACFNTTGRGSGSADTLNGQIVLEESTNNIYFNIIKKGIQPANTATQGIEDQTGSAASIGVAGRQNSAWSVNNETRLFTPAGGIISYTWSPATFLNSTTVANPIANAVTATTTYTVTAAEGSCSATSTVTLTVNPIPSAPVSAGAMICSGTTASLSATGTGTLGWYDDAIAGNHVGSGTSFTTPVLTSNTTYYVQDSSAAGCVSTRTAVTVTVNALPVVVANATSTILCAGTSITLTGSGATSYTWDNGVTDGVSFVPTGTTTYNITGTDGNGCQDTDQITVTVNALPTVVANATSTAVCAGTSLTLTGSGVTSYTWDNGVTDGIVFTPTGTATYIVTGTDANGCQDTDMITVTVNSLPVVVLGSDVTQCGVSVVLDAGNAGFNYLWSDSSAAQTLTVSTSGTYSVTVTNPGTGCSGMDTVNVTINSLPLVALGSDVIQCGGTITLDAGNAGFSYLWSDASTMQTLTVSASGLYNVTVTNPVTGCSGMDTVNVTINSIPVVSLGVDVTQCGGTITLDAGNTGSTYLWNDFSTAQILVVNASGMYYVSVDNGSCATSDTINVTINPVPAVAMAPFTSPVCDNAPAFTLTNGTPVGGTYSGTGVSSGMFNPAVSGAGMFLITYTIVDTNTCTNSDTASITVDLCSGIASYTNGFQDFTIYPNPASGMVNVAISNANFSQLTINIVDLQGKEVYNVTDKNISANYNKQINIEKFAKGVYYIKLNTGTDSKVQKLIVH